MRNACLRRADMHATQNVELDWNFREGAARVRRLIAQIAQLACVSSEPDWRYEGRR